MKLYLVKKICLYCETPFEGDYRRSYCNDLCRSRAAYHRFVQRHPDKKTKPKSLQRWYAKRANALNRGLEFTLTDYDVQRILTSPCFYCGVKTEKVEIERFDNEIGYTSDNCVASCGHCNRTKSQIHGSVFQFVQPFLSNGFRVCVPNDEGNLIQMSDGGIYKRVGSIYE